jgi:hypothetical protein
MSTKVAVHFHPASHKTINEGEDVLVQSPALDAYLKENGRDGRLLAPVPEVLEVIAPHKGGNLPALKEALSKFEEAHMVLLVQRENGGILDGAC